MDSFPLYLPSNASAHLYPENTATNYRTRLEQPIRLDGSWEVGLQGINYASQLDYREEKETLHLNYEENILANDEDALFQFRLTPDEKWKGTNGVMPDKFETNGQMIDKILEVLNGMNDLLLKEGEVKRKGKLFGFYKNSQGKVYYEAHSPSFALEITRTMSDCLGFGWTKRFARTGTINSSFDRKPPKTALKKKDYKIWYFSATHQKRKKRLIFKAHREKIAKTSIVSIQKLWKERVEKFEKIKIHFTAANKMIIENNNPNITLVFSRAFQTSFHQYEPIIGTDKKWAAFATNMGADYPDGAIFIDVYSTDLEISHITKKSNHEFALSPWKFSSNEDLVTYINYWLTEYLKRKLRVTYDEEKHKFSFTIADDSRVRLQLGSYVKVYLGETLSEYFGFRNEFLPSPPNSRLRHLYDMTAKNCVTIQSMKVLPNILKRQQHLFLLCSAILPTAYGDSHLPILRDFIHENGTKMEINEKSFNPIMYLPLRNNFIDFIHIQLTDSDYNPVNIKDRKSLVTLFFRKVNENSKSIEIH